MCHHQPRSRPSGSSHRAVLAALVALCALVSCSHRSEDRLAIIAYVHGSASDISAYPIEELTHINYSFLRMNGSQLMAGTERDSLAIASLVALKERYPDLKVMLSVGGWGGCKDCSEVFSTAQGRREFSASAKAIIELFGADGIDLDWEYPAIEGYPGYRFAPEDRENFTSLVRELRTVLGSKREITFAAGGFTDYLTTSIDWTQVMPLVDKVNVMTYDLVHGYSTRTGHHTPLYSCPEQRESADYALRFLDSVGVPRHKIILGAAFYGRVWENVPNKNDGLFQPGVFKAFVPFKQLDSVLDSHGAFVRMWDSTAQAPYAYNEADRLFATYDDHRSIALKTRYVLDENLGGIMFWELRGDLAAGGLLHEIAATVRESDQRQTQQE